VVSDDQNPGPPPVSAVPTSAVPPLIPSQTSAMPSSGAAPAVGAPARAPRRGRRILLIVAIVVAFLVLLGGTIGVVAYDKATAIDRSTPGAVTQQFLEAAIIAKDPARVGLFICARWTVSGAMAATGAASRPDLSVNWGIIDQSQNGESATVDLRVRLSFAAGGGLSFREIQPWRITLANENGWRVCSLEIGPSVNE